MSINTLRDQSDNYTILLITDQFPYGHGETFLETEIKYIAAYFKHVIIYSQTDLDFITRPLPDNCCAFNNLSIKRHVKNYVVECIYFFLRMLKKIFLKELIHGGRVYWHPIALGRCLRRLQQASMAQSAISYLFKKYDGINIIYSYWLNAGVLGSIAYSPSVPIISRVHGGDLYAYRYIPSYLPFQRFCIENIAQIYAISNDGYNYLLKMYPQYKERITIAYLGVLDIGKTKRSSDGVLRIVSCSNLIPLKRVDIIAHAVSRLPFTVEWVHFGDGPEMPKICNIMKHCPNNIRVIFKGKVKNIDVLNFYKNNPVDLFITTSLYEGIPVSIMEAASCGIPVMATSVGGIPEIVRGNDNIGILLPPNVTVDFLVEKINQFYLKRDWQELLSEKMYAIFEKKFNADINYSNFMTNIIHNIKENKISTKKEIR